MTDQHSESGYELVLDNRRLIIAFAVLVFFFSCFFVVGFMEGKRQGFQAGAQTAAETIPKPVPDEPQIPEPQTASTDSGTKSPNKQPEERPLEWYKSVSERAGKPEIAEPAVDSGRPSKEGTAKPPAVPDFKPSATAAASAPAGYSVQVGAFRQRQQADTKAEQLRAKGFDCRVEPPDSPEGLYLLKVGKFKSRPEAVAMQLRLKQNGFSSFIKTY